MSEKNIDGSVNITIIVYFNDSATKTVHEGVAFMCDYLAYVLVPEQQ